MSYRLKPSEPLDAAVRRLSRGQIGRNRVAPSRGAAAAAWVHETRKSLKRLRAVLRLVRFGLAKKDWRRANDELRDIGRQLSALRERDVLPQSIAALRQIAATDAAAALDRFLVQLDEAPNSSGRKRTPVRLTEVSKALHAADTHLGHLDLTGSSRKTLSDGLAATHRAGQRALAAVQADATDDAMHDLRKVVQIHWRQMQLLEPGWPEMLRVRVTTSKNLAQSLGEHHDLAMIVHAARGAATAGLAAADVEQIEAACRRAQAAIEVRTLPSIARLFAADPQAFAAEIIAYWDLADAPTETPPRRKKKVKNDIG